MIEYIYLFPIIILIFIINNFFKKKKILLNITGEAHQRFTSKKNIPLSGGIFLIVGFIIFFDQISYLNKFIVIGFYLVGFLSDIKFLKSPLIRLALQILITFLFIHNNELFLENTRVILIDQLLEYKIINYLFVIFCITIIINGTNFTDGVNCNVIGYYLLITLILFKLNLFTEPNFNVNFIINWILLLLLIYILNFFNKTYLGDNGL